MEMRYTYRNRLRMPFWEGNYCGTRGGDYLGVADYHQAAGDG